METTPDTIGWVFLTVGAGTCAALLLFSALASFFIPIPPEGIPRRSEIRRCMFMGLYCNPRDPRVLVPRPNRSGWTINVRSESMAMLFFIMLVLIVISVVVVVLNALP